MLRAGERADRFDGFYYILLRFTVIFRKSSTTPHDNNNNNNNTIRSLDVLLLLLTGHTRIYVHLNGPKQSGYPSRAHIVTYYIMMMCGYLQPHRVPNPGGYYCATESRFSHSAGEIFGERSFPENVVSLRIYTRSSRRPAARHNGGGDLGRCVRFS